MLGHWNASFFTMLRSTLLDHQVVGRDWCVAREVGGCILADDMGLGKTVTTCAVLVAVRVRTIIVAPLSLMDQWKTEIAKHTEGLGTATYHGESRIMCGESDIVITNPETVLGDFKKGRAGEYESFQRLVVDEAHILRNPKSKIYEAISAVFGCQDNGESVRKLFLTGTPVCNKSEDFIALITLLNLDKYSYSEYWRSLKSDDMVAALQHVRREYVLRRTKEEVLGHLLPKKEVRHIEIRLEESELYTKEYRRIHSRRITPVIAKIIRLRQCLNQIDLIHPAMRDDPSVATEYGDHLPAEVSAKLEYIRDTISTVPIGEKIVIFSQWTSMLKHISQTASVLTNTVMYHGKLSAADKRAVIDKFNTDPDVRVLLISLKSGGCGLNLCVANHVIITEPYFNIAEEKQAIDRVYRIGQTRNVVVHKLFVPNTVESWMHQLQRMKSKITESVLEYTGGTSADIDQEKNTKVEMFHALVQ